MKKLLCTIICNIILVLFAGCDKQSKTDNAEINSEYSSEAEIQTDAKELSLSEEWSAIKDEYANVNQKIEIFSATGKSYLQALIIEDKLLFLS